MTAGPFELTGYASHISAAPGERVRFMVSCEAASFAASFVRVLHGDDSPEGPGRRIEPAPGGPAVAHHAGTVQEIHPGSSALVDGIGPLDLAAGFSLELWFWPTTPERSSPQTLVSLAGGVELALVGERGVALGVPDGERRHEVATSQALEARRWYRVLAEYEAASGVARISLDAPEPASRALEISARMELPPELEIAPAGSLTLAASPGAEEGEPTRAYFNGKLEAPRVEAGSVNMALEFRWDSDEVYDASGAPVGRLQGAPLRAMTGHGWDHRALSPELAPSQYRAVHFHDDDLDDAGWEESFALEVPADWPSGVYATRLEAEGEVDLIPFVVRRGADVEPAPILVVLPTFTYLAYANEWGPASPLTGDWRPPDDPLDEYLEARPEFGSSLYDRHGDGGGRMLSTRLRPILNWRPHYRSPLLGAPRHWPADLYLIDWLEHLGHDYAVATDEDLNREGAALLESHRVVITGSHPEYVTERMLDATESYVAGGGRLMYLGANGYYWVTSCDPERPHLIEVRRGHGGTQEWEAEPGEACHQTDGGPGGLWRHRGRTPNRLLGIGFTAQGWDGMSRPYRRTAASHDPEFAWIFEGVGDREIGAAGLVMGGAAGDELDRADLGLGTPPEAVVLASSAGHSDEYWVVLEDVGFNQADLSGSRDPRVRADMTIVPAASGGAVFSVGSICWMGCLSAEDYEGPVSTVTRNVLDGFLATEIPGRSVSGMSHQTDLAPNQ